MNEDLRDELERRFDELKKYGYVFSKEAIDEFYGTLSGMRDDEALEHIDRTFDRVMFKIEKNKKNELARNGQFDSMESIRDVAEILLSSEIGQYIEIYGGSVPYFITGEVPKRMIEDIDLHVSLEDMAEVRRIIKSHPELFEVLIDTTDEMKDDFGLEIRVNGTDVSLFPTVYTDEGRITRNFEYSNATNIITAKETLFYGLTEENATTTCMIGEHEARVETPEIIYCQKSVAKREKDLVDLEVLEGIVTQERVEHYRGLMQTPKKLSVTEVVRGSYIPVPEQVNNSSINSSNKNTI